MPAEDRKAADITAEDLLRTVDVLTALLSTEATRVAWLMGFMVGSALAGVGVPDPGDKQPTPPARASAEDHDVDDR